MNDRTLLKTLGLAVLALAPGACAGSADPSPGSLETDFGELVARSVRTEDGLDAQLLSRETGDELVTFHWLAGEGRTSTTVRSERIGLVLGSLDLDAFPADTLPLARVNQALNLFLAAGRSEPEPTDASDAMAAGYIYCTPYYNCRTWVDEEDDCYSMTACVVVFADCSAATDFSQRNTCIFRGD